MIETYQTRKEAMEVANKMVGYKIEIKEYKTILMTRYVIQCNGNKYLHTDGYVK